MKQILSGYLTSHTITESVSHGFDMECKMKVLSDNICKLDRRKYFEDVAKSFIVILDDTVTVIVDDELKSKLNSGLPVTNRELQRGSVNIRKTVLDKLKTEDIKDGELFFLADGQYDDFIGYMRGLI